VSLTLATLHSLSRLLQVPRVAYDITPPADLNNGAIWWLNSPQANSDERWRERCEEHIDFTSHDDSHVRVIGQIRLPDASTASFPHRSGERLFLIPYFWLGKGEPRTSHYEIKGIDGCAVPIYTRATNVAITADVFEKFAIRNLRSSRGLVLDAEARELRPATTSQPPNITLSSLLHRLAAGGLMQSRLSLRLIMQMLAAENGVDLDDDGELPDKLTPKPDEEHERYEQELKRYARLLRDIAVGELLWVPLLGRPGTQARLELSYTARAKKPPILRQSTGKRTVTLRCVEDKRSAATPLQRDLVRASAELERSERARMTVEGHNLRVRSTTRRIWNYFAHVFGYAAYETLFSAGAMRRWSSYHLHVSAPPGVEIRGAQLLTRLEWEHGVHGHVRTEISAERAHLMISKAQFTTQAQLSDPLPVRIRMRSAEKHAIWFAAGIAWLVAAMLWLFATAKATALSKHDSAISEILVIVPALLLTFAARPGEHGFASRVLAGVRTLMLVSGTCCVAAAVILSRAIWTESQFESLHNLLVADAWLATLIAGLLSLTVILTARWLDKPRLWVDRRFDNGRLAEEDRKRSHRGLQRDRGSKRYRNVALILFALQLVFLGLLFLVGHMVIALIAIGFVVVLLAILSAVLAARGESVRTEKPHGAAALLGLSAAFGMAAVAASVICRVTDGYIPRPVQASVVGAMALLPGIIVLLSRMRHFQLTGQPGYDFALRQTEGDFEKRPELTERLKALIGSIFQPVPPEQGRFGKINPFRPDKETVYVDLAPIDHPSPPQPMDL
jgi:hypothetical protein